MQKILLTATGAAAAITIMTGPARATLSEPDAVYYGTATTAAAGNTLAIRLSGTTVPLATCTLGTDLKYTLRVPMDAFAPRTAGTALSGDAAEILNGTAVIGTVTIPAWGTLVRLDFESARTTEQWAADHPGDDGSGDMNRNGISDLQDYLNGNDPAACIWAYPDAAHAETTVYHPLVLQNCLSDAGADQRHNLIRVARGTYPGAFSYAAGWNEQYGLTLSGGYDPADTNGRQTDPALTVLDGDTDQDGIGNGIVLAIDTDSAKCTGTVRIENLTVRNGAATTGQKGGGIRAGCYQGAIELVGNIISGNSADSGGGGAITSSDSGPVLLVDNILYANSAAGAAALQITAATGPVVLLNNTIAGNSASTAGAGTAIIVETTAAAVDLTNNIVYGTAAVNGEDVYINSSGATIPLTVSHNVWSASGFYANAPAFAADASNIDAPPQFVAPLAGNYRLKPGSPCLDGGIGHPDLPTEDAGGAARTWGSAVDPGAYEFHGATTNPATALTRNGATLHGTANANNADTMVFFQYGRDTGYGFSVAAIPGTIGGVTDTPVSAVIDGLSSGIYHYRIAATSSAGVTYGGDLTFSTVDPLLKVTITGNGAVHGSSILGQNYSCATADCPATPYVSGDRVTLSATASADYLFSGWGGDCAATGDCSLTMDADRQASALFTFVQPVRLFQQTSSLDFGTIAGAYAVIADNATATIACRASSLTGWLAFDRPVTLQLKGGYDTSFGSNRTDYTTIQGGVTIGKGSLTVEQLIIR
ncbi:hypothetical protein GURASL_19000 [Geotalea uraniireducens]|uniref:Bacterial repeat domain-containing protein n=1 Tax=Geotalea uraniireducens TaxID=351604 RepID=A0ABN6VU23_9BACT|nr:choice-of-anchor Q domain-containing protein [Geotalea uraniireducens]BDV42977.1 hypothetical protein GURASL_19000 [Geotalea uraniireducens]